MRLALLASALLLAVPARADVCTWIAGFGDWNTPANWSCRDGGARVPAESDTVIHTNGNTLNLGAASPSITRLELSGTNSSIGTSTRILTVTGTLNISGTPSTSGSGVLRLVAGATGTITGVFAVAGSSRFLNEGTLTWPSGRITISNPFADGFTNLGAMTVSTDASSGGTSMSGGSQFVNGPGATLTRTGTGDTRLAVYFRNEGAVHVQSGQLSISQGVARAQSDSGTYTVAAGTTLRFGTSDLRTIAPGASITGAGSVLLDFPATNLTIEGTLDVPTVSITNTGRLTLNSTTTIQTFTLAGGTLDGTATVTIPGSFTWAGGTLTGSGTLTVPVGATLTMDTNSMQLRGTRQLVLEGTGTWPARVVTGDATATFINRGTLAVATDAISGGSSWSGARFENAAGATFTRSGTGQTRMGGLFDNAGTVEVASGELWLQNGGTQTGRFTVASGALLELANAHTLAPSSTVEGSGTVRQARQTEQIALGATVRPGGNGSTGTLAWAETSTNTPAPFAPTADAVLEAELGGTTAGSFDQVAVTNNAVLGGTLRVRLAGGFVPALGDRFPVVTCAGTCSGTFATLDFPNGLTATVEVSPQQVELVVSAFVAADPTPTRPLVLELTTAPNPAVGSVRLGVSLPETGDVTLTLHDALGRTVAVLATGPRPAGTHEIPADLSGLPGGVYLLRLVTEAGTLTRPLTVAR